MKKNILLILIVFLATFFRFWQLGVIPASLTWDEVAWGYNAYALGVDGRDEFGRFLPHDYLESFGDFKPPMYAYLGVVPVKVFGLNEFATRFPSAFFGVLTVLITYFLVKRLFWKSERAAWYGLASSLFLAISPWHIMLSRAAFEANVATCFIVTGAWLFLGAVEDRPWYLPFSFASFIAGVYTFNSARVVGPLLLILLSLFCFNALLKKKKQLIVAIILGILLLLPTAKFLLSPQASLRFQEVNIFSDVGLVRQSNQEIQNDRNAWWSKIIHNRRLIYTTAFLHHYFDNLNPSFLFIKGDGNPKFSTQDVGEMYLWDLPFLVAGVLLVFRKKEGKWWAIPLWLIIGIIPAATARETPHALRIEGSIVPFYILTAYGFVTFVFALRRYVKVVLPVSLGILLLCVLYFQHGYYVHYTKEFAGEWQYGYIDALSYAKKNQDAFTSVFFTEELGRPYIYYLFYNHTTPSDFRKSATVVRDAFGFVDVTAIGKYHFVKQMPEVKGENLYIATPQEVPGNALVKQTFYLPNGNPILVAYTL